VIWNTFFEGRSMIWIVSGIELSIICFKKIARKAQGSAKEAINIYFSISLKFLNILIGSKYLANF